MLFKHIRNIRFHALSAVPMSILIAIAMCCQDTGQIDSSPLPTGHPYFLAPVSSLGTQATQRDLLKRWLRDFFAGNENIVSVPDLTKVLLDKQPALERILGPSQIAQDGPLQVVITSREEHISISIDSHHNWSIRFSHPDTPAALDGGILRGKTVKEPLAEQSKSWTKDSLMDEQDKENMIYYLLGMSEKGLPTLVEEAIKAGVVRKEDITPEVEEELTSFLYKLEEDLLEFVIVGFDPIVRQKHHALGFNVGQTGDDALQNQLHAVFRYLSGKPELDPSLCVGYARINGCDNLIRWEHIFHEMIHKYWPKHLDPLQQITQRLLFPDNYQGFPNKVQGKGQGTRGRLNQALSVHIVEEQDRDSTPSCFQQGRNWKNLWRIINGLKKLNYSQALKVLEQELDIILQVNSAGDLESIARPKRNIVCQYINVLASQKRYEEAWAFAEKILEEQPLLAKTTYFWNGLLNTCVDGKVSKARYWAEIAIDCLQDVILKDEVFWLTWLSIPAAIGDVEETERIVTQATAPQVKALIDMTADPVFWTMHLLAYKKAAVVSGANVVATAALAAIEKKLRADPLFWVNWLGAAAAAGDIAQADIIVEKALSIFPALARNEYFLNKWLYAAAITGNVKETKRIANRIIELAPETARNHYFWNIQLEAHALIGDIRGADATAKKAERATNKKILDDPFYWTNWLNAAAVAGDTTRADQIANKALGICSQLPQNHWFWITWMNTYAIAAEVEGLAAVAKHAQQATNFNIRTQSAFWRTIISCFNRKRQRNLMVHGVFDCPDTIALFQNLTKDIPPKLWPLYTETMERLLSTNGEGVKNGTEIDEVIVKVKGDDTAPCILTKACLEHIIKRHLFRGRYADGIQDYFSNLNEEQIRQIVEQAMAHAKNFHTDLPYWDAEVRVCYLPPGNEFEVERVLLTTKTVNRANLVTTCYPTGGARAKCFNTKRMLHPYLNGDLAGMHHLFNKDSDTLVSIHQGDGAWGLSRILATNTVLASLSPEEKERVLLQAIVEGKPVSQGNPDIDVFKFRLGEAGGYFPDRQQDFLYIVVGKHNRFLLDAIQTDPGNARAIESDILRQITYHEGEYTCPDLPTLCSTQSQQEVSNEECILTSS